MELHLMRPEWLWTLIPAAVLLFILWRQRGNQGGWQSVIAPELLQHLVPEAATARVRNLLPLVLVGWLLAAVAASGPSWQKLPQPIHQKQDALVVLLDLSYSMKSGDLAPSRLDRARQKLLDLLKQRREGQTGLVAYAGDAHIVTPLTDDIPTITNLLPALNPDMMPLPGSDPVGAMTLALELLHSAGVRQGKILLVTDGISENDRRALEKALSGSDALLSIMGVGSTTGAPIPLPRGGFLRDEAGTIVMPGLEEESLRQLAEDTGGRYRRMQVDDSDLKALLADRPLEDTAESLALDRTADAWEDQGYLLVLSLLPVALGLFRRGWLLALLPCLLLSQPGPAQAQTWDSLWLTPDQQGKRALDQGDSETAETLFENPDWAGTAAYRGGDYDAAAEHFATGDNADRLYNRGNALARAGELDAAIAAYEESLTLKPDQQDAQENLDLLKQLKEQQQQQDQEQNQNQDQDQNQDQSQDQNQDQQQNQEQQQSQDQQQDQGHQQNEDQRQEQGQQGEQDQQQEPSQPEGEQAQREEPSQQAEDTADQEQREDYQAARAEQGDEERDQAMEQWLRRVPDDPSGLLREKFRYETRRRQQQGEDTRNETYW